MSFQLIKPTKSNAGSACQFNVKVENSCVYAQLTKQVSWMDGHGTFKGGLRIVTKLAINEIGAILDCLEFNREFSTVHKNSSGLTQIHFKKYARKDNPNIQVGYSFTLGKKDGEETKWFYIGITFAEGQVLKEYLRYSLGLIFAGQDFARIAAVTEKQLTEVALKKETETPNKKEPEEVKQEIDSESFEDQPPSDDSL